MSVYDEKIKKLYGQKAPVTTYDEHFKNTYGASSKVDYSLVGNYINEQILTSDINTPLKVLEAHLQELDTIMESDWFQNLENSDLKESIENAYTFVDDLITRKNGEIQDLRIDLAPIINGSLADIDLESIFSNNLDLREVASNYLLDYDWGDASGTQISKAVEQFMLLFGGAFKDLDPELLFGGENPIADYFIRAIANGENQTLIGNMAESVNEIFTEGMSTTDLMNAIEQGRKAESASPIWGAQMAAAQQIVDGRNAAIKYIEKNLTEVKIDQWFDPESNLTYSKTSRVWLDDYGPDLIGRINSGEISKNVIELFNNAMSEVERIAGPNMEKEKRALIENLFTMPEDKYIEWVLEVHPTLSYDDSTITEQTVSFRDQIQNEINAINETGERDENGDLYQDDIDRLE